MTTEEAELADLKCRYASLKAAQEAALSKLVKANARIYELEAALDKTVELVGLFGKLVRLNSELETK